MQQEQQHEPAVGGRYRVIRPAEFVAEVLEKPDKVLAFDGFKKVIEPLPEHLKAPEWLWVRKLRTGRRQWLNRTTCQLVPMP